MNHLRTLPALLALLLFLSTKAFALDTRTRIFDPAFASLKVSCQEDFWSDPVIRNGTDTHVVVSFDEFVDEVSHLRYRLLHCNADWQPSNLVEAEYLDGFNLAPIEDYAFSYNTFVHFVNYRIVLPNEQMQPLVSGNYLLQVFPEEEPERILLQARFSVSEEAVAVSGSVSGITDRGVNDRYQQLQLMVDRLGFPLLNPMTDLLVTVEQNNDPTTLRTLTVPLRTEGQRMIYEHRNELIFDAGNEFRRFETVAVPLPCMRIDSSRYYSDRYTAFITPDEERTRNYFYDQTQQGRFLIREHNSTDSDLGADYVDTQFTLRIPEQIGASVMLQGELTQALPDDKKTMVYDPMAAAYTLTLALKQGSYNYRYALKAGKGLPSPAPIEGNHYETRNEYTVRVYYRAPGSRGDRLLSVSKICNF